MNTQTYYDKKTENRDFYRKLFAVVLPVALQNLLSALVSASDALMLGFLDQSSLSAVSLATQISFVQSLFLAALMIGSTTLAAQYWGRKDKEAVERVLAVALKFSAAVSVVFFAATLLGPDLLMRIFTGDMELISRGSMYLRVASVSYLFMGITQIYLCIMKNSGRVARSTVYGSVSVLLNILFNTLLIFGLAGFPRMGIVGAALATVLARTAELALVIYENTRREEVCIRLRLMKEKNEGMRKDFVYYTTPVMLNELVWGGGVTMFSVILGHMGSDAVAANSIANIAKNIIACACLGLSSGAGILIGNELGAGRLERAKRYGGKLCRTSFVMGVLSGILILLCRPLILKFAVNLSPQAYSYLKAMLVMCSYYLIGKAISSVMIGGIFCAGGDTRFGLYCDGVNMWAVVVPLGALAAFVFQWPVLVVYFILNLDEMLKIPVEIIHYKKYKWVKNLTMKEEVK